MLPATLFLLASQAWADVISLQIEDMICTSCEPKIAVGLDELPFLTNTKVSFAMKKACSEISGPVDEKAIASVFTELGYNIPTIQETEACDLQPVSTPKNWADTDGFDAAIISSGEAIELSDHQAKDKFTIYDFGAPWCAPCHAAEKLLKQYLQDNPDVAVRAVVLDSPDPTTSFNMPAAKQHLMSAPGLPYFIVTNSNGKVISRGVDLPKVLRQIDKRR